MSLSVNQHPFYKPLWRRIAIVALTLSWVAIEVYARDGFFLVLSLAFLAYSIWVFLVKYKHEPTA